MEELPPGEYWLHRAQPRAPDYESGYWGTVTDPDGNVRDRTMERAKHLEDVQAELAFVNALPGGRLLDVGCGLGFFLSGVNERWQRHGTELSAFAAAHARKYGTVEVGELAEIAFPTAHFDAVVCHHVIEHVPDPAGFLREVYRILRPGGALVLGTPDFDSGCARRFGEHYRLLHDSTHVSLFSADSMRRFLRDNGFDIQRVDFPFFETRYFTEENLLRLFDTNRTSPPFYGNFMTFYCRRLPAAGRSLSEAAAALSVASRTFSSSLSDAARLLADVRAAGGKTVVVPASPAEEAAAALMSRDLGATLSSAESIHGNASAGDAVVVIGSPGQTIVATAKAAGARVVCIRVSASDQVDSADVVIDVSAARGPATMMVVAVAAAIVDSVNSGEL